jgi:hypothetical protein
MAGFRLETQGPRNRRSRWANHPMFRSRRTDPTLFMLNGRRLLFPEIVHRPHPGEQQPA